MDKNSKIYIAGHTGFIGSALTKRLIGLGYKNLILRTHKEADLTDQHKVMKLFNDARPEYVFLMASKTGGILSNSSHPAGFIYHNLAIQTNIIHAAYMSKVKKLLFRVAHVCTPSFVRSP